MYKSFDFECQSCKNLFADLIDEANGEGVPPCPECKGSAQKVLSFAPLFTAIVPDYPGSWKHKAGYQHHIDNRPREKIGVSVPAQLKKD